MGIGLVVSQAKFAGFVVSALALKSRSKVLTTNLFTHQSCFGRLLAQDISFFVMPELVMIIQAWQETGI